MLISRSTARLDPLADEAEDPDAETPLGVEDQVDGLVSRTHPELAEGRGEMALDGALREIQALGDLAVHVAHHEQAEDLLLTRRERGRIDLARVLAWDARLAGLDGRQT